MNPSHDPSSLTDALPTPKAATAVRIFRDALVPLSAESEIPRIFDDLLLACTDQTGAASGGLFALGEAGTGSYSLRAFVRHGRPLSVPSDPLLAVWRDPVPTDESALADEHFRRGEILLHDVPGSDGDPTLWSRSVAFHRALGHRAVLSVPMRLHGRLLGFVGLGFSRRTDFVADKLDLILALTMQVTLAFELTRLAGKSVEAAVARGCEQAALQRTSELEEANALLARATQGLTGAASPDAFVIQLQLELCALLGGEGLSQFRLNWETRRIQGYQAVQGGRAVLAGDREYRRPEMGFDEVPVWQDSLQEDRVLLLHPDRDAHLMHAGTVAFLRQRGYRWLVNLPLFVRGRPTWVISVVGRDADSLTERNLELFRLLARQLTLALELRQLSVEAGQLAAAREREEAARVHAGELARTNEAMQRGSEAIATAGSDTAVMGALLAQATTATGAAGAAVKRRVEPGARRVALAALSQDGVVLEAADIAGLPCVAELEQASAEDPTGYYHGLLDGTVQSRRCEGLSAAGEPLAAGYHEAHGHRVVWDYPFREDGEVAGWISLAFVDERVLDPAARQILAVLASHVALALKMIRLSGLAREAAVNEERNRLAGEIHDSLAQSFAGIAMQLESAEDAALSDELPAALSSLRRAREVARFGLAEARRSVLALRPVDALAGGLVAALRSLAERSCVDNLLRCRLEVTGTCEPLGAEIEMPLFRIAQEALSNAVRHGRPTEIVLRLDCDASRVRLSVQDDGVGIDDLARVRGTAIGGLRSIHQRATRLGGNCEIDSTPGRGTTLRVFLPGTRTPPTPRLPAP